MPARRVKTPWIEALTKSREDARAAAEGLKSSNVAGQTEGAAHKMAEVDPTPKRMADSYHSVVCCHLSRNETGPVWLLMSRDRSYR